MPVVCDFTVISGGPAEVEPGGSPAPDGIGTQGDPYVVKSSTESLRRKFDTGGRHHSEALITFMIKGPPPGSPNANIRITNTDGGNAIVGAVVPTSEPNTWRHEQIVIPTNVISSKSGKQNWFHMGKGNYQVRDIICFFHQSA